MSDYIPITKAMGWHCGEDATFVFVVRDKDGIPQDLDMDLAWSAYSYGAPSGTSPRIGPYDTLLGITVVTVSLSSVEAELAAQGIDMTGWPDTFDVAKVAVPAADTAAQVPGMLSHELWRTDSPKTLLAYGPAELQPSIRR